MDSCIMAKCIASVVVLALTTALRYGTHLATAYFDTKKGQPSNSTNAWNQKCTANHWIVQINNATWHPMNQSRNKDLFSCYIIPSKSISYNGLSKIKLETNHIIWYTIKEKQYLNGSQLVKLKKSIPLMQGRSSWSRKLQLYLKTYDFCEYVKSGAISCKINILPITSWLKFKAEKSFAHVLLLFISDYPSHSKFRF